MIDSCSFPELATFTNKEARTFKKLNKINLIFGNNGTGKTTLSRALKDKRIEITSGESINNLNFIVYNIDYVKANFSENENLPGIFTLGKDNIEIENNIKQLEDKINKLQSKIDNCNETLGVDNKKSSTGMYLELFKLKEVYEERFWNIKTKLEGSSLKDYIGPYRSSKEKFCNQLICEYEKSKNDGCVPRKFDELEEEAKKIDSNQQNKISPIQKFDFQKLESLLQDKIFCNPIVGKSDSDVSALIVKLNNSDWVKAGLHYTKQSEHHCPFCQQKISDVFINKLNEYFDETYKEQLNCLKRESESVKEIYEKVECSVEGILSSYSDDFVEQLELSKLLSSLKSEVSENIALINEKLKNPSKSISLKFSKTIFDTLNLIVDKANKTISDYNFKIQNIDTTKNKIRNELWNAIVQDEKKNVELYLKEKADIEKKIKNLQEDISSSEKQLKESEHDLITQKMKTTSCIPTMENINYQLKLFGFSSFKLELAKDQKGYQLIRISEKQASISSLSEGERNFLSFLYFYSSLDVVSNSGKTNVLVIDDPMSSMDSEVAYIVSSMIRRTFQSIIDNSLEFNQIFVFTHNLFFLRELFQNFSKNPNFSNFLIKKNNNISSISEPLKNPLKSSYQMLWQEYRNYLKEDTNDANYPALNVMRRILEYFFNFINGGNYNELQKEFEGDQRIAVRALLNNLHSNSHGFIEDVYYTPSLNFKELNSTFRSIFERTNNLSHYEVMSNSQ